MPRVPIEMPISVSMALHSLAEVADLLEANAEERTRLLHERDRLIRDASDQTVNVTKIASYARLTRHGVYAAINRTTPED